MMQCNIPENKMYKIYYNFVQKVRVTKRRAAQSGLVWLKNYWLAFFKKMPHNRSCNAATSVTRGAILSKRIVSNCVVRFHKTLLHVYMHKKQECTFFAEATPDLNAPYGVRIVYPGIVDHTIIKCS